jgi:predicted RNA-binding Zn-ribbon protein involved in translation (DUF1610 family)
LEIKTFLVIDFFLLIVSAIGGGWWWVLFVLGTALMLYKGYGDMVTGQETDRRIHTCPKCGTVGAYQYNAHTRDSRTEGIVRRKSTRISSGLGYGGRPSSDYSTEEREERAPVIRTTTYMKWECSACGYHENKEDIVGVDEVEDFERPIYQPERIVATNRVIERERMRIPCRFCGVYVDPLANRTCPNCGAALK